MKPKNNKNPLTIACLLVAWSIPVQADILTDGTVGDVYYLFGDNMIIPQDYGTTVGNNLFHSFSMFNIYSGEAVTFTGANNLENVIARVTGGDASMINGVLSSSIGKANFYFINPAGVTFGKNAVVDVPAAFHVSTANQINFADGSVYSATNPAASTLTIAKPESFGFVGQTGDIVLDGAQIIAKPNQTIDLVANNITLKNEATVEASEVRLVATKGGQNVSLVRDENGFLSLPSSMPNDGNAGNIVIDKSLITSSNDGKIGLWGGNIFLLGRDTDCYFLCSGIYSEDGSNVFVKAGSLWMSDYSDIYTYSDSIAADISVIAGSLWMNNGAGISAYSYEDSYSDDSIAANISVTAGSLNMDNSASIYSVGSISITADILNMNNSASIYSYGSLYNSAFSVTTDSLSMDNSALIRSEANDVSVTADSLSMDHNASIYSYPSIYGGYSAFSITAGSLSMDHNASIYSYSSDSYGYYDPSVFSVTTGSLSMDHNASIHFDDFGYDQNILSVTAGSLNMDNSASIYSEVGSVLISTGSLSMNNASIYSVGFGSVSVTADSLSMNNSANIRGIALIRGGGPPVSVTANFLSMDNSAWIYSPYKVSVTAGSLILNNKSKIFVAGYGGGYNNVAADNIVLLNGSLISQEEDVGIINVSANNMIIDGQGSNDATGIFTTFLGGYGGYGSGNININVANQLTLLGNSMISSSSFSESGNAGNININAGNILIDGLGGGIDHLTVWDGQKFIDVLLPRPILPGISSDVFFGSGQAGNINITTNTLDVINGGAISTETLANNGSNGGNISIHANDYLYLENSRITTTANGATSNGGNININTPVLVMNTGLIQANAEGGKGGDINLNLQALIPSYNSLLLGGEQIPWQPYIQGFNVIQAASAAGVNGTVNISSPQFDISGSISGLNTKSLETPRMKPSPCNLAGSSLKRKGKGGLPRNEKKYLFIPPVTTLPKASDAPVSKPENTSQPQTNQPCKATAI